MTVAKTKPRVVKAKREQLMQALRDSFPRLQEACDEVWYDPDYDDWTRAEPAVYAGAPVWNHADGTKLPPEDPDEETLAMEAAWAETYAAVLALEAAGLPVTFRQGEAVCTDVCGLSFSGTMTREIKCGRYVFESWTHDVAYQSQAGCSFEHVEADDEPAIPAIFFQRLGFERDNGLPWDDESAVAWAREAGLELDEDFYGEEEDEDDDEEEAD